MGLATKGDLVFGPQLMGLLLPPGRWLLAFGGDDFLGGNCMVLWAEAHGTRARGREERRHHCRHKSSQTGVLVGVTAPLWPRNPLLHVLARSNNPSCLLEAGHLASSTPLLGVPASPRSLRGSEQLPAPIKPKPRLLGAVPAGREGRLGSVSLTAWCKPSWGRFLLRFLALLLLPAPARRTSGCDPWMDRRMDGCSGRMVTPERR